MSEAEKEIRFDSNEIKEDDDLLVPIESDRDTALKAECLRRQLVIKLKRISMKRIVLNANNELGNVSSKYSKPKRNQKNELTPYARQICNTIIQIPEIQKFISICIDAAPIGHMKCHNNFDIVQSCWP